MRSEALALARVVEILGKTVVAIEPDKGSFDHPSAGEDVEAGRMVGTLEDFDGPLTKLARAWRRVSPVKAPSANIWATRERGHGSVSITNTAHHDLARRQHGLRHRRAARWCRSRYDVCDLQPLLGQALDLLPASPGVAALPRPRAVPPLGRPLSVVLTDWLSITPADRLASHRPPRAPATAA